MYPWQELGCEREKIIVRNVLCSAVRWSLWKLRNNSVLSMQELELFAVTMVTYVISDQAIGAVVPHGIPTTIQRSEAISRLEELAKRHEWLLMNGSWSKTCWGAGSALTQYTLEWRLDNLQVWPPAQCHALMSLPWYSSREKLLKLWTTMLYYNHCLAMISSLMNQGMSLLNSKNEHMDLHGNLIVQCPIVRCLTNCT